MIFAEVKALDQMKEKLTPISIERKSINNSYV